MACEYALIKCRDVKVSEEEFREWIRRAVPEGGQLLDWLDDGWQLEQTPGFPVTPGEEKFQIPIVAWLRRQQEAQRAITARGNGSKNPD